MRGGATDFAGRKSAGLEEARLKAALAGDCGLLETHRGCQGYIEAVSDRLPKTGREPTSGSSGKAQPLTKLKPSEVQISRSKGRPRVDAHSLREGS